MGRRGGWLGALAAAVVLAGLAGCGDGDDDAGGGDGGAPLVREVDGFGSVSFVVRPAAAAARAWCALLAATPDERRRGLMGRRDLGGYDAMLFAFETDTAGGFWMRDTLIPLSIAWFDAGGRWVGAADMDPCTVEDCPLHHPPSPYRWALEVPRGGLDALGAVAGSRLEVGGGRCAPPP